MTNRKPMPKHPREGMSVRFNPSPVSLAMYSRTYDLPSKGAVGRVVTIPVPGGRKTHIPGPMGGLVFVSFASLNCKSMGIAPCDLERA